MYDYIITNYYILIITYTLGIIFLSLAYKLKIFEKINTLLIVIIGIFIFQVIGLPFSQNINLVLLNYEVPELIKYIQVLVVFTGLFSLLISYKITTLFYKEKNSYNKPSKIDIVQINEPLIFALLAIFTVYAICNLFILFIVSKDYNPIIFILGGYKNNLAIIRFNIANIIGSYNIISWFFDKSLYGVMPALFFLTSFLKKNKVRGRNYAMVLLTIIVLGNMMVPQKSRLLFPIVFFIASIWFANNYKSLFFIKLKHYYFRLIIVVLGLGTLVSYIYTKQYSFGLISGVKAFLYRITVENARNLELYIAYYPKDHPFLFGGSTQLIRKIFGIEGHNPDQYLPWVVFEKLNTSWPTSYLGCAWADFGIVGVIAYSLLIGLILGLIDNWAKNWGSCPVRVSIYFAILFNTFQFTTSNMFTSLLNGGVLLNIIHIYIALIFSSLIPIKEKSLFIGNNVNKPIKSIERKMVTNENSSNT